GIRSLGQPLKSFRDRPVEFPAYLRNEKSEAYLHSLGPLIKPHRGSIAGLKGQQPTPEELEALPLNETAGFGVR
ncbi:MAG: carbon-nitrogen hydrolase family protein, partial [Gammaproteobacteria bacterium]|nr:carbon-nitrogen hydrolase family protein [Gammaproteobacteria bacterium]